jgi:uncharacterized RDD family membrane protein YckC
VTYGDDPSLFRLSASAAADGESEPSQNQLADLPLFGNLEDPEEFEKPAEIEEPAPIQEPEVFQSPEELQGTEELQSTEELQEIEQPWEPELETPLEPQQLEAEFSEKLDFTEVEPAAPPEPAPSIRPASLTDRLGAALLDLAVMAGAAIALAGGAAVLGATPQLSDWPLLAFPWLLFSFLYHVIPMAFWGQTPGMASMSLTARTLDDRPLSLGQAVRRWLATLGTTLLLGLPSLLALTGRSATDRLSQSATHWKPPVAPAAPGTEV